MTSIDRTVGDNSVDADKLVQIAEHLVTRIEAKDEIAADIKALKSAGKALGLDMDAVAEIVKLKMDESKLVKLQERVASMRVYGPLLGIEDPFA
jgi:hypothetical protein